jgi:SAM-dependent methyltransferase
VILDDAEATTLERIDRRLASIPLYRFYPANELNRDYSNWFSLNQRAIEDGLRTAGFEPILLAQWGDRVAYRARKRQGPQPYLQATYEGTATKSLTRAPLIQAAKIARDPARPAAVEPRSPSVDAARPGVPDRIARTAVSSCWCGGALGELVAPRYRRCGACGSAVLAARPTAEHFRVVDDARDFYGRTYWTEYAEARSFPDICARARTDLSERCVFWLARLLEAVHPPGRVLEIGCGHGGFVKLMRELGFDAVGTELSPWVVDFARRTFEVPVLLGQLDTLALEGGVKCIAAFDVLEHLDDPLATMRRCRELLAGDGALLLQTPWYRGEGPEWSMFQPDEHIHLFTETAVQTLLRRAGFEAVTVQPSLFPHDMWVVARPHASASGSTEQARIPAAFQALLGLQRHASELGRTLGVVEADRGDRLTQVHELTDRLQELTEQLVASEADRAERLDQIHTLTRRLTASDADRAERLAQVNQLTRKIHEVSDELATANADRAARLTQIHELTRQIRDLTGQLATSEADRQARLDAIQALQTELAAAHAELDAIRNSWAWKATRPLRLRRGRSPR